MRVCFLLGSPEIGGGTYVIFEHALHLQERGWDVTVVPIWPVRRDVPAWHRALDALRFATLADVAEERFDIAIATWWRTIYDLLPQVTAARYCYFVQSVESWFYPEADVAVRNLVNATYLLPLPCITEARWIRDHLDQRFRLSCDVVPNGCRKAEYRADGPAIAPRERGRLRVLVEGPLGVGFKNVARTIALVRRSAADEVWLLTASDIRRYPGVERVFSRVPTRECGPIYRSCDVLVKLSTIEGMFGPPLEMFHCGGTAIVYDVTGHDEYIENGRNAIVIPTGGEDSVVAAIGRLKQDAGLLATLCDGALATAAAWPDWTESSPGFAASLERLAGRAPADRDRLLVMIGEFRAQYLRATRNAPPPRWQGLAPVAMAWLGRRAPGLAGDLRTATAWLVESRRSARPPERI